MQHRVHSQHDAFTPSEQDELVVQALVDAMEQSENVRFGEIALVLMADEEHTILNIKYLAHNYSTDILTFDLSEGEAIDGDIYINWDVCENNAKEYEVTAKEECYRLFAHGLLHLMGYDDSTEEERKEMSAQEDRYLQLIREKGFM